jgi:aminodeoxyfutalosine deaminase
VKYRERGVVGIGLGGPEDGHPPEPYAEAFALAREGGLASVPHAGEGAGAASVRGALETLHADRIRHGVRAVEDAGLVGELAGRGTVLDVCPISNVRLGIVPSLGEHPLPQLVAAGIRCSISTDDPAIFGTDLTQDYEAAASLGVSPRAAYEAGVAGALCDNETRERLRQIGDSHDWADR